MVNVILNKRWEKEKRKVGCSHHNTPKQHHCDVASREEGECINVLLFAAGVPKTLRRYLGVISVRRHDCNGYGLSQGYLGALLHWRFPIYSFRKAKFRISLYCLFVDRGRYIVCVTPRDELSSK